MGLVSEGLIAGSALTVLASLGSRDRAVTALSAFLFLDLLVSLFVHWTVKGVDRSTPLMLSDCAELYVMGLVAVCRLDRPLWLYGLCVATALECLSHLAYVAGAISANGHILSLNLLFIAQLCCLLAARSAWPEHEAHTDRETTRARPAGKQGVLSKPVGATGSDKSGLAWANEAL